MSLHDDPPQGITPSRHEMHDGVGLVGWEQGRGQPVLLLHAGGEHGDVWRPVVDRLAVASVRAVVIDQRGHGGSGGVAECFDDFGHDVATLMGEIGQPCVVVGASLGGLAAIAARCHEVVRRLMSGLVLVDVVPDPRPSTVRPFLAARDLLEPNRRLIDDILGRGVELAELLGAVDAPVMLVRATASPIADTDVERLVALVPGVEIVGIEAGHLVARDAPAELADVIATFVPRCLPTGSDRSARPKGERA